MIRYIRIISVFFIAAISLYAQPLKIDYNFLQADILQKDQLMSVTIKGCRSHGSAGNYVLPVKKMIIALPQGMTAVSVDVLAEGEKSYAMMLPPEARGESRPLSMPSTEGELLSDEFKFQRVKWSVQTFRGVDLLVGALYPAEYNDKSKMLSVSEKLTLSIDTKTKSESSCLISQNDINILKAIVDNPEQLTLYSRSADAPEQLLVVTRDSLVSCFDPLLAHYHQMGIETQLITAEEIELDSSPAWGLSGKIRLRIKDIYLSDKGLDYVLIGGADKIIPARRLSCAVLTGGEYEVSDDIPSDLYYAALDGTWDNDGDAYFGEYDDSLGYDEADLLQDVAIGRMPAYDRQDLTDLIAKTLAYQWHPVEDDLDDQLLLGEELWPDPETWGADYMEMLVGSNTSNGYSTIGIPSTVHTYDLYEREGDEWSFTSVLAECEAGRNMIHHAGHASVYNLMGFNYRDLVDSALISIDGIQAQNPFIISHGCNSGAYDYTNAIGPGIVNNKYFSVGGLFNSRFGWFNEGTTEGPAQHMHREFLNAIYGLKEHRAGQALKLAKLMTAPWVVADNQHEQNALRWNFYDLHLLGDPALALYGEKGRYVEINCNEEALDQGRITVTLTEADTLVSGCHVALVDGNDSLLAAMRYCENGHAEFIVDPLPAGEDSIFVIVSGNDVIPQKKSVEIRTAIDPVHNYQLMTIYPNPFNPNATLSFQLSGGVELSIRLLDSRGRAVKTLANRYYAAGEYTIPIKGQGLSSGIYFCILESDSYIETQKIVLLK